MKEQHLFNKNFTLVVIGQIISLFGNAILRFALPLYLLRTTGSPTLFGIVTACSFLPMAILSFLGGVLADRLNKRNIMVTLDFLTALIILVLSLVLGKVSIVPLFILVLMLLYGISGTYQPTVQASIPFLVSEEKILPASAVINQVNALANLLGPVIGGMLFGSFGITPILIISIICFVISAIMEIFIDIPHVKRDTTVGIMSIVRNDLTESIHYMKTEKPLLIKIIALISIFNLVLTAMIIVGLPIIFVGVLGVNDTLLGIAQGIVAFGGLCGGILTAVLGAKLKVKNSHYLLFLCGLSVFFMGLPILLNLSVNSSYILITAMSVLIMIFATMFSIQMIAMVQTETPSHLVGKVIACMMAFSMCSQPIGQVLYGFLFDKLHNNSYIILFMVSIISCAISLISKKIFSSFKR